MRRIHVLLAIVAMGLVLTAAPTASAQTAVRAPFVDVYTGPGPVVDVNAPFTRVGLPPLPRPMFFSGQVVEAPAAPVTYRRPMFDLPVPMIQLPPPPMIQLPPAPRMFTMDRPLGMLPALPTPFVAQRQPVELITTPPTPAPEVVPVAAPIPTMTIMNFVRTFRPTEGTHEMMLVHPDTGAPVRVTFTLPAGRPMLRYDRTQIEFNYGDKEVEIHFRKDGTVKVYTLE